MIYRHYWSSSGKNTLVNFTLGLQKKILIETYSETIYRDIFLGI